MGTETDPSETEAGRHVDPGSAAQDELRYPENEHEIIGVSGPSNWRHGLADELPWWERFADVRENILLDYGYNTARAYWGDLEDLAMWCARRGFDPFELTDVQVRQYFALLRRRGYSESTIRRRQTSMRKLLRGGGP